MNRTEQARLFFILLDAAEEEARLQDPIVTEKWRALKARFDDMLSEQEHGSLQALLDELDRSGALVGTWIQARWFAAKARSAEGAAASPGARPGGGFRQTDD